MLSDLLYISPSHRLARLHSALGGQVWMFAFEYEGIKSFGTIQKNAAQVTKNSYGVTHMDDLFYVLPNEYINEDSNNVNNDKQGANTYSGVLSL